MAPTTGRALLESPEDADLVSACLGIMEEHGHRAAEVRSLLELAESGRGSCCCPQLATFYLLLDQQRVKRAAAAKEAEMSRLKKNFQRNSVNRRKQRRRSQSVGREAVMQPTPEDRVLDLNRSPSGQVQSTRPKPKSPFRRSATINTSPIRSGESDKETASRPSPPRRTISLGVPPRRNSSYDSLGSDSTPTTPCGSATPRSSCADDGGTAAHSRRSSAAFSWDSPSRRRSSAFGAGIQTRRRSSMAVGHAWSKPATAEALEEVPPTAERPPSPPQTVMMEAVRERLEGLRSDTELSGFPAVCALAGSQGSAESLRSNASCGSAATQGSLESLVSRVSCSSAATHDSVLWAPEDERSPTAPSRSRSRSGSTTLGVDGAIEGNNAVEHQQALARLRLMRQQSKQRKGSRASSRASNSRSSPSPKPFVRSRTPSSVKSGSRWSQGSSSSSQRSAGRIDARGDVDASATATAPPCLLSPASASTERWPSPDSMVIPSYLGSGQDAARLPAFATPPRPRRGMAAGLREQVGRDGLTTRRAAVPEARMAPPKGKLLPRPKNVDVSAAFGASTTSTRTVDDIVQQIKESLRVTRVKYHMPTATRAICTDGPGMLSWEMEVVRLNGLDLKGIQLRRLHGDIWKYKEMVARVMHHLRL